MKPVFISILSCFILFASNLLIAQQDSELSYEKAVQTVLKTYGYYYGLIDGEIDYTTRSALRQFQTDIGISVTGNADNSTADAMLKLLETPMSKNKSNIYSPNTDFDTSPYTNPTYGNSSNPPVIIGTEGEYLGSFSRNKYDPNSVSNPYGTYGSEYSPNSINNPYGRYGSPYSSDGAANPYTTGGAKLYGSDGKYLGRVNSNPYDPESISNPNGQYGSPYSPNSVKNPYSKYGDPFSPNSATNPYSTSTDPYNVWDE